jgi:hypothetical protein
MGVGGLVVDAIPEIEQAVEARAAQEGKPVFIAALDLMQQYWAIPIWAVAGLYCYVVYLATRE